MTPAIKSVLAGLAKELKASEATRDAEEHGDRRDCLTYRVVALVDAINIVRNVAANTSKGSTNIVITRTTALRLGIVFCTCGHPPNNHFEHGSKPCARCDCKEYVETIPVAVGYCAVRNKKGKK